MANLSSVDRNTMISRIAQGDEDAFTLLFRMYHRQLGAFVATLVKSPELQEEIVQDVFVKIWMDRAKLERVEKLDDYLFIVTRNYTLNCIRKIVADRKKERDFHEEQTFAPDETTLQGENEPDYLSLLDRAAAQLPPQQQLVFNLRRQGLKNQEIADQLGIHTDSVKKYQQLAVRAVSDFIKLKAGIILLLQHLP